MPARNYYTKIYRVKQEIEGSNIQETASNILNLEYYEGITEVTQCEDGYDNKKFPEIDISKTEAQQFPVTSRIRRLQLLSDEEYDQDNCGQSRQDRQPEYSSEGIFRYTGILHKDFCRIIVNAE